LLAGASAIRILLALVGETFIATNTAAMHAEREFFIDNLLVRIRHARTPTEAEQDLVVISR